MDSFFSFVIPVDHFCSHALHLKLFAYETVNMRLFLFFISPVIGPAIIDYLNFFFL